MSGSRLICISPLCLCPSDTFFLTVSSFSDREAMATHSSTLAWKIPWTQEPGRLQPMASWRVRHGWVTSLWLFTFMHWRRKWQPTPVFLPWESQGQASLVGCHLWGCRVGHDWSDSAAALLITYSVPQASILAPSPAHLHNLKLSKAALLTDRP